MQVSQSVAVLFSSRPYSRVVNQQVQASILLLDTVVHPLSRSLLGNIQAEYQQIVRIPVLKLVQCVSLVRSSASRYYVFTQFQVLLYKFQPQAPVGPRDKNSH